jgi:type IV pilus biogenesis protein CpaD/CtpE
MRAPLIWLALLAVVAAAVIGCATTDPDAESSIPWNAPQPWEGAPSIPGFEGR